MRTVTKESAKWRSGRVADRLNGTGPCRRGGKIAGALGDHEGEAAEHDGNVMMPTGEGAALEVVEAEFALQVLVHALGSPALLEDAHDLLLAHLVWQRAERKLGRLSLVLGPLDDQPKGLSILQRNAIVVGGLDLHEAEARAQARFRAIAPGELAEGAARKLTSDLADRRGFATRVQRDDL